MEERTLVPFDIYEWDNEMVILIPLGGVSKDSVECILDGTTLLVKWERVIPKLKKNLNPSTEQCHRGNFEAEISLPSAIYFDKIFVKFLPENILTITVPKLIVPDKVKLEIKYL